MLDFVACSVFCPLKFLTYLWRIIALDLGKNSGSYWPLPTHCGFAEIGGEYWQYWDTVRYFVHGFCVRFVCIYINERVCYNVIRGINIVCEYISMYDIFTIQTIGHVQLDIRKYLLIYTRCKRTHCNHYHWNRYSKSKPV